MAQPPKTGASTRRAMRVGSVALAVALLGALAVGCSSRLRRSRPARDGSAPGPAAAAHAPARHPSGVAASGRRHPPPASRSRSTAATSSWAARSRAPTGPVEGATVRLERFVGEQSGTLDVRTNADGRWVAIDVYGGRYRIRAWKTPALAMAASDVRFIAADAEVDLALAVDRYDGSDVTGGRRRRRPRDRRHGDGHRPGHPPAGRPRRDHHHRPGLRPRRPGDPVRPVAPARLAPRRSSTTPAG